MHLMLTAICYHSAAASKLRKESCRFKTPLYATYLPEKLPYLFSIFGSIDVPQCSRFLSSLMDSLLCYIISISLIDCFQNL